MGNILGICSLQLEKNAIRKLVRDWVDHRQDRIVDLAQERFGENPTEEDINDTYVWLYQPDQPENTFDKTLKKLEHLAKEDIRNRIRGRIHREPTEEEVTKEYNVVYGDKLDALW